MKLLPMLIMVVFTLQPLDGWAQASDPGSIRMGSWNIRNFSLWSRDDREIDKIARIISQFDILAIQNIQDTVIIDKLKIRLYGWKYLLSPPVEAVDGKGEHYAFIWDALKVHDITPPRTISIPDNGIMRQPFAVNFRSGHFDFTLVTTRLTSDSGNDLPIQLLVSSLIDSVQVANGDEQDIIIAGDFNRTITDFSQSGWSTIFLPPDKTTIDRKHLYDNIWIDGILTTEFSAIFGIVKFDETLYDNNLLQAATELSDHRVIWAEFNTDEADDDDEGYLLPIVTPEYLQ